MKRLQKENLLGYLPIVPFALIVVCYELLPLAQLAASSLVGKESGMVGLENFIKVFTTPLYQMSIRNSIRISLLSALVGILVAFLAARFCHEASPVLRRRFTMLLNMTSNFSGVPLAFAFMVLMGNTGVLTILGRELDIPLLENFDLYSGDGLMLVYIYFQIPLADYWFRIVIPNLLPSILGTLSVLFANALAAYATAYALVMNNYALLALQITSKYKGDVQIDKATGGALAMVLILLMVAATMANNFFTKRAAKGRNLI